MDIKTLDDIKNLRESYEFEAKIAAGRDGDGELPNSVWETYSAMANTSGGTIVLGIKENRDGSLEGNGIKNTTKVLSDFWNIINNKNKVSVCLLNDDSINLVDMGSERSLIVIKVPRANRRSRPVFLNGNPLGNTYRRNNDGDFEIDDQEVKRMMADSVNDTRDDSILKNFSMNDFDLPSISAYRNEFRSTDNTHPWLSENDKQLLINLGAWRNDRETKEDGPTLAGILMFGKWRSILEAVPTYNVDYRDLTGSPDRWSDRVIPNGTWSGNLYDFARKVYPKLTSDLKLPFQIKGGKQRIDVTPVHEALREALINSLIHTDYSVSGGIVILKKDDGFSFTNPGGLRLPREQVMRGGRSDCRNLQLQVMFQLIGSGDKAGSGIPRILSAWSSQHWTKPLLNESVQPESVSLEMHMVGMFPDMTMQSLRNKLGNKLDALEDIDRMFLAIAEYEGEIHNRRLQQTFDNEHPRAITDRLNRLVDRGLLIRQWNSSWTTYQVADGRKAITPLHVSTVQANTTKRRKEVRSKAVDTPPSLFDLPDAKMASVKGPMPIASPEYVAEQTKLPTSNIQHPTLDIQHGSPSSPLPQQVEADLTTFLNTKATEEKILQAAQDYISLGALAQLLGRNPEALRLRYITQMVTSGILELKYPDKPKHPRQAYRARKTQS
ncbi:RNA-binding domain-containing protein [Deinococcus depolymerans]|uniref:Schlafen AlbA-2 domain-containing protein n=1 Tax=Deinococcus depolymerans TaxID=392408 RepID=A0ABN1BZT9_9DEIO